MKKRVLSFILAFVLIFSCAAPAFAAGPLSLTADSPEITAQTGLTDLSQAPEDRDEDEDEPEASQVEDTGLTKFESSGLLPFSETEGAVSYDADDIVTFIVVMEEKPLLEKFSVSDIVNQTAAVQSHEKIQTSALNAVKTNVQTAFGSQEGFELGYTYTVATTGFSVTTAYGNMDSIAAMSGVKSVYVAPVFSLPESGNETVDPLTNNATTMIGANVLNDSGYTGKGMRIAILDTGLRLDHPNFADLSEDALVDPMTRESVEEIWDTLNAGQMTHMLNVSYHNSKVPFVFNYEAGDFNVDNTYAGSDHGTHVAGIAAANKVEGSDVVGVAPDAQLVIMQVFQSSGGANWATIMAALEDCVRLEVDVANLSLGAAAGFTDPEGEMLATMDLFLDSDIQIVIASGNENTNAYGNAWGYNMSLISNPDIGLTGTPGTYSAALSVASVDNDGYDQLYITVGGQDFGYLDTAVSTATSFIANFQNQELEYVVVPGVGEDADYEGLDVTGKVALVSRGTTSFPEKQAVAQAHGAIACVVYNNTIGVIYMQINDGEGNIPAVSVSKAAGAYLIEQAGEDGVGTLKVCNADVKTFKIDQTVSSFSSWGVTPDLKLKPEIAGVGGSVYSTVDPSISGSYYGSMSGTSMASPQVAGAMAVLIQYLDENYPELTGAQQRKVAANLLMSTAVPVMATDTLEYSPRAQGAGLANLVNATTSGAYLSNPTASEGRPKAEFGDDPEKSGVYTFSFEITNMTGSDKTYTFDSSVLTESIYADYFIANSPYGLEAKVETPDSVTVPANSTVTVNATLTLTENDKAYLDRFPNGIYVEGYLYAIPQTGSESELAAKLVMPMVGFYGDWSDADIFDEADTDSYSLYPSVIYTYYSQVGYNPYFANGKSGDKYNAVSYNSPLYEIDFGMLRNAKYLTVTVTDNATGEVYHELEGYDLTKSYYNSSYGMVFPTYLEAGYGELWDGMDADGNMLPDGTTVTYDFQAWLDDGDDVADDSWSFQLTLDNTAPKLTNEDALQSTLRTEDGHTYLTLDILENHYAAAVIFMSSDGVIMGKYEPDNEPGVTVSQEFEITGFGEEFTIILGDYACNETEIDVVLDLEEAEGLPTPSQLDKDRLYGNETFDGAQVDSGWFSASKADFSDPRNETFDGGRYYAAEYVNGYIIGQNVATGNIDLLTPTGTYWRTKEVVTQYGSMRDGNFYVMYDMALDHSASEEYDGALDKLYAVGWYYAGDQDGDGKDDGYNALFEIVLGEYGNYIQTVGIITDTTAEVLTLGITTDGQAYGIDMNGILYTFDTEPVWDDTIGDYGDYAIVCETVGTTSFVEYPGYGGCNVIQSMGYDHNTGTMYWYAHSQVQVDAYSYANINVTYAVDLETAECTEIGTYGQAGPTCLFVPNDLQSNLFTMGVQATNFEMDYEMYLVEGQNQKLNVSWSPWNAAPADLTWTSSDESIATVDESGRVTAVSVGTATISASAEVMLSGYWDVVDGNWIWRDPAMGVKTVTCNVTVLPSEDALYSYVIADYDAWAPVNAWYTYSDQDTEDITEIGTQIISFENPYTGELMEIEKPNWQGGAYMGGYIYTTVELSLDYGLSGTGLFRSKVTQGQTPAETVIGEPEYIGFAEGVNIAAIAFDYNTSRMYCIEDMYVGGLGIINIETGAVDMLGNYTGDLAAYSWVSAMTVTADGTIVVADGYDSLYTLNPDTLETRQIHQGEGAGNAYWAAMAYNYNTGYIYWNPCQGSLESPLCLVMMPESEWGSATVVELGDVNTKYGVQQTVLFTIPDNEPESKHIDTQSIAIAEGETITGLEGGSVKLNAVTEPARPTVQAKTWTSSDESVVTVDRYGNMTYVGVGTATVTVSISNKDGSTFTDSIQVTVLEAAGAFTAFLDYDAGGSEYYDFWLQGNDYDLPHTAVTESMISVYSLRTGTYYDGYFYAYNDKGQFLRIDPENPGDFKILGTVNLDLSHYQVTGMAMDYTTGTMYGLTLCANYDYTSWTSVQQAGSLVTIDLDTGAVTEVAQLDASRPVYTLACDAEGTLYAAGSTEFYATYATVYTLDKETAAYTEVLTIDGACVYTDANYYGNLAYNSQMTYDFGTNRLYLHATRRHAYSYGDSYGMYMIQLGEDELSAASLGTLGIQMYTGNTYTNGQVYLGMLAFIPEADEVPVTPVNGIILNKTACRIAQGSTIQLEAQVRPSNAADPSVTWSVEDESIATVDENGLVTGVGVGVTTVTVTSNETGVTNTCTVTVVDVSGPATTAYTVSANKDSLIRFNPALPGVTDEVVCTFSGGSTIVDMAYADNCLLYVVDQNYSYYLYRFDLTTKQSTLLGQIYAWTTINDIAYDSATGLLYATAGFYVFEYDVASLDPNGFNYYSNYVQVYDSSTGTDYHTAAVAVVNGEIYVFANDYYSSEATLLKYSDKYLSDLTVVATNLNVNLIQGSTDAAYDASAELFYLADSGDRIYSVDLQGNAEHVDMLGNGIDMNGLAIDSTPRYTVVYTDGVEGVELFADQKYAAAADKATPAFSGELLRVGHTFSGWTPEVAETVTAHVTYTATWTANTYKLTLLASEGSGTWMDVTYGQSVGSLPVPSREGYTFLGWYDADGNHYTAETVYLVDGDLTLYASWYEGDHICYVTNYSDLTVEAWYHEAVDYVVGEGLMNGVSETVFAPYTDSSRGMMATVLYRLAGSPSVEGLENPFEDVAEGTYYYDAIVWAYSQGIVKGMTATIFAPNDSINRAQMVTMLWRYAGEPETDVTVLDAYSDSASVGNFAVSAYAWAIENGIINGIVTAEGDTILAPNESAQRVMMAAVLYRYDNLNN